MAHGGHTPDVVSVPANHGVTLSTGRNIICEERGHGFRSLNTEDMKEDIDRIKIAITIQRRATAVQ